MMKRGRRKGKVLQCVINVMSLYERKNGLKISSEFLLKGLVLSNLAAHQATH